MNEQAIRDAFDLFVANGYPDTYDNFKRLMQTNQVARKDAFDLFVANGYPDTIDNFNSLMGASVDGPVVKKKEETIALQPNQKTVQSPSSASIAGVSSSVSPSQNEKVNQYVDKFDPKIVDLDEGDAVTKLQYLYGDLGFSFEESTPGVDAIKVTTPTGVSETFSWDAFTDAGDKEIAESFKSFLKKNIKQDNLQKFYSGEAQKFVNNQDVEQTIKSIAKEQDDINKFAQDYAIQSKQINDRLEKLSSRPPSMQDALYFSELQNLRTKAAQLEEQRKSYVSKATQYEKTKESLNKSVGAYIENQEQIGSSAAVLGNAYLTGMGGVISGGVEMFSDLFVMPFLDARDAADSKDRFAFAAKELGYGDTDEQQVLKKFGKSAVDAIYDKATDDFKKQAKYGFGTYELARQIPVKTYGTDNVTQERIEKFKEGFWGSALYGTVSSLPAMLNATSTGRALSFAAQGVDFVTQEIENDEDLKKIPESEKLLIKAPIAIASAVLEEFGLRNVISQKGLLNGVVARALSKSSGNVTAKSFANFVRDDVNSMIARGLLTAGAGAAAEFETGALQQLSETTVKDIYNNVKDKEMFKNLPKTTGEYLSEMAYAGAQEAVGGFILGMPGAVGAAYRKKGFEGMSDEEFKLFESMANDSKIESAYVTSLKARVNGGEITVAEGKEELNDYRNARSTYQQLPAELSIENKKKAMNLLRDRNQLTQSIEGKDASLIKPQQAKIADINKQLEELSKPENNAIQEQTTSEVPLQPEARVGEEVAKGATLEQELREALPYEFYENQLNSEYEWQRNDAKEFLANPKAYFEKNIKVSTENIKRDPNNKISQRVINENTEKLRIFNNITNKYKQGEPQAEPEVVTEEGKTKEEVGKPKSFFDWIGRLSKKEEVTEEVATPIETVTKEEVDAVITPEEQEALDQEVKDLEAVLGFEPTETAPTISEEKKQEVVENINKLRELEKEKNKENLDEQYAIGSEQTVGERIDEKYDKQLDLFESIATPPAAPAPAPAPAPTPVATKIEEIFSKADNELKKINESIGRVKEEVDTNKDEQTLQELSEKVTRAKKKIATADDTDAAIEEFKQAEKEKSDFEEAVSKKKNFNKVDALILDEIYQKNRGRYEYQELFDKDPRLAAIQSAKDMIEYGRGDFLDEEAVAKYENYIKILEEDIAKFPVKEAVAPAPTPAPAKAKKQSTKKSVLEYTPPAPTTVADLTVYRGIGNNVMNLDNNSTLWVAEDKEVAKNYAGRTEDGNLNVEEIKISKPTKSIELPYKLATDVRASNIGNNLRLVLSQLKDEGKIEDDNISNVLDLIREFENAAGENLELFSTKINKPEASEAFSKVAQALGFDSVVQKESASKGGEKTNTYGIFKNKYPSLLSTPAPAPEAAPAPATTTKETTTTDTTKTKQNEQLQSKRTGDRGRRSKGRKLTPLEGTPTIQGIEGPDEQLVAVAEKYAAKNGIKLKRQSEYVKVDPERAKRIADAYEEMADDPNNPKVKKAYKELIRQTIAQYQALVDAGYKFWFMDLNIPSNLDYASSPYNALRDLRQNKEMGVFPTTDGYGNSELTELDVAKNPLLADTGIEWSVGGLDGPKKAVLANDLFRAVHDAFGHGLEGAGFRERGEENAWQAHIRLFTGPAKAALTSETRGQNSWLNFGPYGEQNRRAKVEDTIFAPQKIGIMPKWTWTEGIAGDMDYESAPAEPKKAAPAPKKVAPVPSPAPAPAPEPIVEAKPTQPKKAVAAPKKAAPAPTPEPAPTPTPVATTTGALTLQQLREEYTLKNMEVRTDKKLTQKQKDARVAELQAEYKEKKKAMSSPKFRTNEPINSTEDVLTGYVGNDLPKVFQLISRIQQAFPNVVVSVDAKTFNNVMNSEGVRPFVSDGVVIYGVTVNGDIYINPEVHNSNSDLFNTSIHEFGHVWQDFLSTTEEGMALLNRGYELIKEAIGVDSYITNLYNSQLEKFNGDERKALNEVTSILIGNKGAEVVNRSISSKIKDWLSDVWNYISSAFKVSDELTDQDIQDMTLEEFIGTALADMLSGKQIKMSDSQLKTLKDSDAAFSTSQNIFDIVSVGRQNGFSDASIKQLLLKRGFKSSDIDAVMQVNLNLFDKLPPAFANVDGGVKVGLDLYNQVLNKLIEFQKAYGYKSMAEIRQRAIELLQANPIFQSQTDQIQKELIVGLDKTLNTKANKSVSALIAGIKNDLKQRVIGSKNLRDAQIAMRTFIRNALPKSKDYSQAQINKLTKIITDTTVDSFMAQSERVIEIVEKQIEKMRDNTLREILSLVTKKAQPAKTTTGKRRSKGLDAQGQSFFEAARDIIKAAILNDTAKMMELAQEIADTDAIDEIIAKDLNGETLTTLEQKLLDKAIAFDTFSDLMSMDLDQLTDVLASLKDERRNSIARLKQTREARALRYNQIRAEADAAVQESFPILFTEDVDADGNTITRVKDKNDFDADKNAIWDSFNKLKIWDGIKKFSERWSLDSLSKIFGFFRNNIANIEFFTNLYDIKGKFFTSKIYDKLNVMYDSYLGGFYKEQDNLDVLANSIDGITKGYKQIRKMLEIGIHEFTLNGKQRLLSGDQMLRLYALSKNSVQRQKLRNMGFTDADMQRIESLLPEQTIEFADKLVNYFSNQYYESVNSVYSSLNDVNLQYVPNYFPTITVATSVDGQVLLDGNFNGIFNAETAPALRERSDTSGDIDLAPDFTSVVESHFQNMEKYKAFAAGVKEMNALFQSKGFNALMEQTSTKQLFKNLVNYTINPNAGPKVPATILDKLYNKYTGFALAFKPIQLPKQLTAFIFAYDNYQFLKDKKVPVLDTIMFMVDNAKVIATLPAQFRKAKEISPTFRDRVAKGIEGDVFGLEAGSQTFKSAEKRNTLWGRFLRGFKTVGAAPTIAGDLLSVMSYMAVYNRNIANGMNPEEALLQFNNYNATLQTRRGTEKSTLQTSQHAAVRAFTMFGSTAFLQMNGAAISMQNIMRSIKNKQAPSQTDIRRFVISFGLANFLFTFVANFPKFMYGDDEDREKAKRAMYDALIGLNLIYQIPLIGSGIEIAVNKARGERMPVEGTVNPITSVYRKIDKGYKETGEWTSAIRPAIELGIGAQLDPLIGVYSGAVDGFDENTVYDIMGISQSYRPSGDTKKEAEQKDKSAKRISDISQFGMTREELKKSNPGMYKVYFPVEAAEDEEKKQEKKRMQPPSSPFSSGSKTPSPFSSGSKTPSPFSK